MYITLHDQPMRYHMRYFHKWNSCSEKEPSEFTTEAAERRATSAPCLVHEAVSWL